MLPLARSAPQAAAHDKAAREGAHPGKDPGAAMVFIGPLLYSIALFRIIKERPDFVTTKMALIITAFLSAAASANLCVFNYVS
jgi:hypothetical protein